MNLKDLVTTLAAPLLTTILGAIGIWIQEWRQTRDQRFQRKQARDEAEATVEFFEKWLQAQQSLCSPQEYELVKANARKELDRVYQRLLEIHDAKTHVDNQPPLFQRALLLYSPPGWLGWIAHIVFYLFLAFFIFASAAILTPPEPGTAPLTALEVLATDIVLLIPVLIVRAWAVELKTRQQNFKLPVAASPSIPSSVSSMRQDKT